MKARFFIPIVFLVLGSAARGAPPLVSISNDGRQAVFGGAPTRIRLVAHNPHNQEFDSDVAARILQTSSATAARVAEVPWKKLRLLPKQTVLESARLNFPPVRAATRFVVQWIEQTGAVIGMSEVLVYPTNLLDALKDVAANQPVGVFDPLDETKPLLRKSAEEYVDLENSTVDDFRGQLAIVGPFASDDQMPPELTGQVRMLAGKGVAVVWIRARAPEGAPLQPSFYMVRKNQRAIVVVQPELLSGLMENPESQRNLVCLCKLALAPYDFPLPRPKQRD